MTTRKLSVDGNEFHIKIHLKNQRNSTVSISGRNINIRISTRLPESKREAQIESFKEWARKRILRNPKQFIAAPRREYADGDILIVGDDEYALRIIEKDKKTSSAIMRGGMIEVSLAAGVPEDQRQRHIRALMSRCVAAKKLPELEKKVHELNRMHFNRKLNKITFKNQKSRWGSCSRAGNINISTRLLFAPDDVLEYVCVHELAHLIEHNHSPRFWALVERAAPDYKQKKKWLTENEHVCNAFV